MGELWACRQLARTRTVGEGWMSWGLLQAIVVLPGTVVVFIPLLSVYLASGTPLGHQLPGPGDVTLWLGIVVRGPSRPNGRTS